MIQAAIDLGTVTSRLMIGEALGSQVKVFKRSIAITDMGEGLTQSGVISDAAYARLLGALMQFRDEITDFKTQLLCEGREDLTVPVKIVATSAMRDATNAAEVLDELSEYGFAIEVITGIKEAALSFKGTLCGFSELQDPAMSIDVGGGSTELILGTTDASILASHSFDIGSRRITDLFLMNDPPQNEELQQARNWVHDNIACFVQSLPQQPAEVIAVAGTATTAITVRDSIDEYDSSKVHGKRLTAEELDTLIVELSALCLEERKQVSGLHPKRAPVIIGGLITLAVVLQALGKKDVLVSDTDILQGIILDEATI